MSSTGHLSHCVCKFKTIHHVLLATDTPQTCNGSNTSWKGVVHVFRYLSIKVRSVLRLTTLSLVWVLMFGTPKALRGRSLASGQRLSFGTEFKRAGYRNKSNYVTIFSVQTIVVAPAVSVLTCHTRSNKGNESPAAAAQKLTYRVD